MQLKRIIIVHRVSVFNVAATNRVVAYAKSFAALGKEVTVIFGSRDGVACPVVEGVTNRYVHWKAGSGKISEKVRSYRRLARELRHCDLTDSAVYSYGLPGYAFLPAFHRTFFFTEQTESLSVSLRDPLKYVRDRLRVAVAKRADGLAVISAALINFFRQKGLNNIVKVNMFVDCDRFAPLAGTLDPENVITYCGTISLHKDGVDDLLKAFSIVHRAYDSVRLRIVGGFLTAGDKQAVKDLVSELGLEGYVELTGFVPAEEMPALLSSARILALARPANRQSAFGFPTKLGEYLATGRPVVVTRVGEIDSFLEDGMHCVFAEPDNPEDFAKKLSWMLENNGQAEQIGRNGRDLAGSAFSAFAQSQKLLSFMENVVRE